MKSQDTQTWQLVIFLFVLLLHLVLLEVLIHMGQRTPFLQKIVAEPLAYIYFPHAAPPGNAPPPPSVHRGEARTHSASGATTVEPTPNRPVASPAETASPPPEIDWEHEAALAVQNGIADAEREQNYRDLSASLSPSQLEWIKQNHMQPANPGITWKRPRVEITADGMPIVHINDHCVLVPVFLIPMVFCSIGHITPDGDLLKHMHDPSQP